MSTHGFRITLDGVDVTEYVRGVELRAPDVAPPGIFTHRYALDLRDQGAALAAREAIQRWVNR